MTRIFVVALCLGLALSMAWKGHTRLALISAGAGALLALLPM
jgi:hypothetical protein